MSFATIPYMAPHCLGFLCYKFPPFSHSFSFICRIDSKFAFPALPFKEPEIFAIELQRSPLALCRLVSFRKDTNLVLLDSSNFGMTPPCSACFI